MLTPRHVWVDRTLDSLSPATAMVTWWNASLCYLYCQQDSYTRCANFARLNQGPRHLCNRLR